MMLWLAVFFFCLPMVVAFMLTIKPETKMAKKYATPKSLNEKSVRVEIPLGKGYKNVFCNFRPLFVKSKFITVTYPVPFELNIDKPPKTFPAPIVNKNSERADGEQEGDILRATTSWSQGFQAAGPASDIMKFAGNIKWRKSVYDCTGAPWEDTVNALLSNTAERSESVTLVFERELPSGDDAV